MNHEWLQKLWYDPNPGPLMRLASLPLWPLHGLFIALTGTRRWLYRHGWLASQRLSVPVLVIGNIVVGGVGKSPLTIAAARYLIKQGCRVGILLRGYKGKKSRDGVLVDRASHVADVGDEALMIAHAVPEALVMVDADRVRGGQRLVKRGAQVVICDDGLQHYALQRDMEWCVFDARRGIGNGWRLPLGPLREPLARLDNVSAVLINRTGAPMAILDWLSRVPDDKRFDFVLSPVRVRRQSTGETAPVDVLAGKRVDAVAGIGDPKRFFATLTALGAQVRPHPRADHERHPFRGLPKDADFIVCTAKDAVKWTRGDPDIYVLEVEAQLPDQLLTQLDQLAGVRA